MPLAHSFSLGLVLGLASCGVALAGTVPGRWEKVETLPLSAEILVVMTSGDRIQGQFRGVSDSGIQLEDIAGSQQEIPKSGIRRISRLGVRHHDSLWDGMAVGGGLGAATYLIGHAALCCKPNGAHDIGNSLIFAGIGIGIGALMDSLAVAEEEVVFRAR